MANPYLFDAERTSKCGKRLGIMASWEYLEMVQKYGVLQSIIVNGHLLDFWESYFRDAFVAQMKDDGDHRCIDNKYRKVFYSVKWGEYRERLRSNPRALEAVEKRMCIDMQQLLRENDKVKTMRQWIACVEVMAVR